MSGSTFAFRVNLAPALLLLALCLPGSAAQAAA